MNDITRPLTDRERSILGGPPQPSDFGLHGEAVEQFAKAVNDYWRGVVTVEDCSFKGRVLQITSAPFEQPPGAYL